MSYDMYNIEDIETVEALIEQEGFDYFFTHYIGPGAWINAAEIAKAHVHYEKARNDLERALRLHGVQVDV